MENVEDKRVRVFKNDKKTEIKNFVFLEKKYFRCPKLLVILGDKDCEDRQECKPYLFFNSIRQWWLNPNISPPDYFATEHNARSVVKYTYESKSAVVKGQLHFFGGYFGNNKVRSSRDSYIYCSRLGDWLAAASKSFKKS